MHKLKNYLQDGAGSQARAVLAYLSDMTIEESYNDEWHRYDAEPEVARWENGREQGYIVSIRGRAMEQLNIAFFEHRNSDSICAIRWVQNSMNALTIDTAEFGDACYSDKYDVNNTVSHGDVTTMAEWIAEELIDFWEASDAKKGDK